MQIFSKIAQILSVIVLGWYGYNWLNGDLTSQKIIYFVLILIVLTTVMVMPGIAKLNLKTKLILRGLMILIIFANIAFRFYKNAGDIPFDNIESPIMLVTSLVASIILLAIGKVKSNKDVSAD